MRTTVSLILIAAFALAATGCDPASGPGDPCSWLQRQATDRSGPQTVFLVDRSNSVRGPAGTRGPDAPAALGALAADPAWTADPGRLSIGSFDGTAQTVRWSLVDRYLPAVDGNDELLRQDTNRLITHCVTEAGRAAATEPVVATGSDVLGGLTAAKSRLQPGRGRIVVVTDGLVNVGCADLRRIGLGSVSELRDVAARCVARGELPDLTGVSVTLAGVGHPVTGPQLSTRQTVWVTEVWQHLCGATKASCTVQPDAGVSGDVPRPHPGVADPDVSFGPVVLTLPEQTLFAVDSAELSAAAQRILESARQRIREVGPTSVVVEGHGDSRGGVAYVQRLSKHRAEAVRQWLIADGVRDVTARGLGSTRPKCEPEYRNGRPDQKNMACNRRVELVLRTDA